MSKISLTAGRSSGNKDDNKEQPKIDDAKQRRLKGFVWSDVVKEVMERKACGKKACLFNSSDKEYGDFYVELRKKQRARKNFFTRYRLGAKYGKTYFTRREAERMVCLLKGKKTKDVAMILKLSPRTVEFYIKNMKAKVGCRTKFELIDLVNTSEFMKYMGFDNHWYRKLL